MSLPARAALLALLSLASAPAFAWGDTGHRIVCEIAVGELSAAARAEVDRLIRQDDEFRSFRDACAWPDHPRQRGEEHYANYPRDTPGIRTAECVIGERCVLSAVAVDMAALANHDVSDAGRLAALKFLGHWVGDLHQPLHVSFADDKGGNDVDVSDDLCRWNLHAVWDTCVIHRQLLGFPRIGWRVQRLAARLRDTVPAEQRARLAEEPLAAWAQESFLVATAPATAYCDRRGSVCLYDAGSGQREYSARQPRRRVEVDRRYLQTQRSVVADRLVRAGLRLGALLNRALDPKT